MADKGSDSLEVKALQTTRATENAERLARIEAVDVSKLPVDDETKALLSDLKDQVLGK